MPAARTSILLAPVGSLAADDLAPLAGPLAGVFGCKVQIFDAAIDSAFAYDPGRRQFDASKLLLRMLALFPDHHGKVVGVTGDDLFAPCLTWVYGQGQVDGPAAIVSRRRLDEAFYGRATAPEAERRRLVTEICHELGHTFGLLHCRDERCAMRWSETVEEIEQKGAALCFGCARRARGFATRAA
ncbi:MAG TPA: peptidase M54 [Myxococcales bacterium]|jgi:archaemetzincin